MAHPESDLDPSQWAAVLGALEEVIDLEGQARSEGLAQRLDRDTRLLECAESLLAGEEVAAPKEPDRAGPYDLHRLLGRGGMGAVYLASRRDGTLHRRVALKLVPAGLGTKEVIARFRQERQVQANLSHPGIATLLDGGETETGLPYLVLEYVEGIAIDRWCDEERLSVADRVVLFEQVATAVGHAHSNRVIHRDIKPSNVLVNQEGAPKLLDFGIAKVLDSAGPADGTLTVGGQGPMTPAYASPEQFRGDDVTAASDIYSLGALLFELTCGRLPHDLTGCTAAQMERIVSMEAPLAPGRAAHLGGAQAAETRSTTPKELRRQVTGDLGRILLMCLRKEPERRYPSTSALVADLERYRTGLPILARPDTAAYRVQRFVSRNRLAVGLTALVIAALTTALVISLRQYRRATHAGQVAVRSEEIATARLTNLREFRYSILHDLVPAVVEIPGAMNATQRVIAINLACLDREESYPEIGPDEIYERARCYLILGDLQGSPTAANRGDTAEALVTHRKALSLAESLVATYSGSKTAGNLLAQSLLRISELKAVTGQYGDALKEAERASQAGLAVLETGDSTHREQERLYSSLVEIYRQIALIHHSAGRLPAARLAIARALEFVERKILEFPETAYFMEGDRCDLEGFEAELWVLEGDHASALERALPASVRLGAMLASHEPNTGGVAIQASLAGATASAYAGLHRWDEAIQVLEQTYRSVEALRERSLEDLRARELVIDVQVRLGALQVARAQALVREVPIAAFELLNSAQVSIEELRRTFPHRTDFLLQELDATAALAEAYLAAGDLDQAARWTAYGEGSPGTPEEGAEPSFERTFRAAESALRGARIAHLQGELWGSPQGFPLGIPQRGAALEYLAKGKALITDLRAQGLGGERVSTLATEIEELTLALQ